jgi:hypothetical protein
MGVAESNMKIVKEKEAQLLNKICKEHDLPSKLVRELIRSAGKFTYENSTPAARRKEYTDLITFYLKGNKGDQ